MTDTHRWYVIATTLALTTILSLADVALDYTIPAGFYPFAGLVIGAALARIGGVRDVE